MWNHLIANVGKISEDCYRGGIKRKGVSGPWDTVGSSQKSQGELPAEAKPDDDCWWSEEHRYVCRATPSSPTGTKSWLRHVRPMNSHTTWSNVETRVWGIERERVRISKKEKEKYLSHFLSTFRPKPCDPLDSFSTSVADCASRQSSRDIRLFRVKIDLKIGSWGLGKGSEGKEVQQREREMEGGGEEELTERERGRWIGRQWEGKYMRNEVQKGKKCRGLGVEASSFSSLLSSLLRIKRKRKQRQGKIGGLIKEQRKNKIGGQ